MVEIWNLNERKHYFDTIVRWIYEEFIQDQRHGVTYADIENVFRESLDTTFPVTFVAECDGICVGTVSLVAEDEIRNCPFTPWLASLYVREDYRNRGIAKELMQHCQTLALELGFSSLYLRTEHADGYYEKLGWTKLGAYIDQYGLNTRIFSLPLSTETLKIGCFLSVSSGFAHMGQEALDVDANTFQFFSRNPRGSKVKKIDETDTAKLRSICAKHRFAPLLAHAPYTLNPCSADPRTREFAHMAMAEDLQNMEFLPFQLYNFHPGSHVGQGIEVGIDLIAKQLNQILTPTMTTTVLLETMAGKGSEVGGNFSQLRAILDRVELTDKMGVCLDTCHIHDAGYDIVHDLDGVLEQFDQTIGLKKLRAIHLNDSMNPCGAKKDRHAKIGEGAIGLDAIVKVIQHPALRHLPFYLETPNELDGYAKEIALLRQCYASKLS